MPTRKNFKENRNRRREEAQERAESRAGRGDAGQLRRLEDRGFGECREACLLREKLQGGKPKSPEKSPEKIGAEQ